MKVETVIGFALLSGAGLVLWSLSGVLTGTIRGKYRTHDKREDPTVFWLYVGTYLTIGLILIGFYFRFRPPSHLAFWNLPPQAAKANQGAKACFGKEKCILVFMAPWCPVCEGI